MARVGLMQKAKMQKRNLRKFRGRKRMLEAMPWHEGEEVIKVMDCLNPGERLTAKVTTVGRGYDKGLMFELASKPLITEIECPLCEAPCELNIHWSSFFCNGKHADDQRKIWEKL